MFDSGYGGLTILEEFRRRLPQYDYLYLGDNARTPYGNRSFKVVYEYTWEAVRYLFDSGCPLVILACNTASAKALRSIQQKDLPQYDPDRRVLGILRPTVEVVGELSRSRHIGILGTRGTVLSNSYPIELAKFHPDLKVTQMACPMWVPLVENGEADSPGARYFVEKYLSCIFEADPAIDTLILGCTHYPLLLNEIKRVLPTEVKVICQGPYVAESLEDYLKRHSDMDARLSKGGGCRFLTTEDSGKFEEMASVFTHQPVGAQQIHLI